MAEELDVSTSAAPPIVNLNATQAGRGISTTQKPSAAQPRTLPTDTGADGSAEIGDHLADIIPVDDETSSEDGYGTEYSASTSTSICSSVRDYNFENKRRYHKFKEGRYMLPNDDLEQDREDMKHALVVEICKGALHRAPLDNPHRILDIGTGTGIWAIDMGDQYPEAEIIGLDLSPIQPPFVPPNVQFLVDDVEADWLYAENSIDYIHLRHMAPSIKNWPRLLDQAFKSLKPGGWVEIQEMMWQFDCDDGSVSPDYGPTKMVENIKEALANFGMDLKAAASHGKRIEDAGFTNLTQDVKKVPVGVWPKDQEMKTIGDYCRAVIYDGLHAITIGPFTKGLDWTAEEVEVFLVKVRQDLMNNSNHAYVYYHSFSGQKSKE
ncbi:Demethylmenaquinone methyltransferase 5 [Colletotrichum plurivorum]|uniref:Demethylmenaquinone methyltransferase 5 n=1 Tax=Colletotrichum plurivorum TaxID=2175906 RepID=A0A8H6JY56_9PEZI|nr:Demethylmenaquinone methyltransferase 5 [Colletotrichum plurivorum]